MPIPKPRKGEKEADFISRCAAAVMNAGDTTDDKQAVAMCYSSWRAEHGGKPPAGKTIGKEDAYDWGDPPEPDEGESEDDYMERCVLEMTGQGADDDRAEEICSDSWDSWDGSKRLPPRPGVTVFRTHSEVPVEGTNFVLSDEAVDRMGEVIVATGWQLDNFRRNPVALFNHRADFPIGRWHDLAVKDGKLNGRLELAPKGTSPRIDEIRRLVDAGILRAVSVGFRAMKKEPIDDRSDMMFGPFRYLRQELVECSLVSVPANPNALALAKNLDISPSTMKAVFAGSGTRDLAVRRRNNGGSARTDDHGRRSDMSLAKRIIEIQNQIVERRDALTAHLEKIDDSNVSDADLETTQNLNAEIAQLEKTRSALVESEKNLGASVDDGRSARLPIVAPPAPAGRERTITSTIGKKNLDLLDYLVRGGTVAYVSKMWGEADFHRTRVKVYGDDDGTKAIVDLVMRAASAPAMTSVTGWAAELVQQVWVGLMPTLMPNAILTRLAAKGLSLSFGRAGKINIPTRSRTPTIAGSFVGEGQAIPVRQGAFTTQALTPKKMAVITTWTREMDEHSIPAIEGILREAIQVDTSVAVDSVLLDANPATTIRPAGLLNGVAATAATAGGGLAAIVGDIRGLISALSTATYGNVRTPVWLMNPTDLLGAGLISAANTGIFPFAAEIKAGTLAGIPYIDSATVTAKTMILVDAADFVVADGGAPRFEISDQATLHMEDTTPLDLVSGSPGTVAAPQRSLFQTDSLALRMVMPLNWLQRRAGTVAWTQNVTW